MTSAPVPQPSLLRFLFSPGIPEQTPADVRAHDEAASASLHHDTPRPDQPAQSPHMSGFRESLGRGLSVFVRSLEAHLESIHNPNQAARPLVSEPTHPAHAAAARDAADLHPAAFPAIPHVHHFHRLLPGDKTKLLVPFATLLGRVFSVFGLWFAVLWFVLYVVGNIVGSLVWLGLAVAGVCAVRGVSWDQAKGVLGAVLAWLPPPSVVGARVQQQQQPQQQPQAQAEQQQQQQPQPQPQAPAPQGPGQVRPTRHRERS